MKCEVRLLAILLMISPLMRATVIVQTSLALNNFTISVGADSVQIQPGVSVSAYATAADTLGDSDFQYNSDTDTSVNSSILVTLASASAAAGGSDSIPLTVSGASGVSIPSLDAAVLPTTTEGQGEVSGNYEIVDPSNPTVNATFTLNLTSLQSLATDAYGLSADSETTLIFDVMDLNGFETNFLFQDSPLTITGPNQSLTQNTNPVLIGSTIVPTNTPLFFYIEADAESDGFDSPTPEPAALLLTAAGLSALLFRRFRRVPRS